MDTKMTRCHATYTTAEKTSLCSLSFGHDGCHHSEGHDWSACDCQCQAVYQRGTFDLNCTHNAGHAGPHQHGSPNIDTINWHDEVTAVKAFDAVKMVDHPAHYGGEDNVYEAIKVIDAWALGFSLGNAVKYICRAGKKPRQLDVTSQTDMAKKFIDVPSDVEGTLTDLKKARWYLDHEVERLSKVPK